MTARSSWREWTSSWSYTLRRWYSTVFGPGKSWPPPPSWSGPGQEVRDLQLLEGEPVAKARAAAADPSPPTPGSTSALPDRGVARGPSGWGSTGWRSSQAR